MAVAPPPTACTPMPNCVLLVALIPVGPVALMAIPIGSRLSAERPEHTALTAVPVSVVASIPSAPLVPVADTAGVVDTVLLKMPLVICIFPLEAMRHWQSVQCCGNCAGGPTLVFVAVQSDDGCWALTVR